MHTIRLIIGGAFCGVFADVLGFTSTDWKLTTLMVGCFVTGGICAELSAHEIEKTNKRDDLFIGED